MLNVIWISEQIAISPAPPMDELGKIKKMGFDAIIDIRSEDTDDADLIRQGEMAFLHVPVDDCYAPTLSQLHTILEFANPLLDQGKKVLIHCQNGYGRSPLVAASVLIKRGMDVSEALMLMEDRHPTANFSDVQERFIYHLERK